MIRYYPSFAVKTNLIAGEKLFTSADGTPYSGPYYETSDGQFFSGPNPIIGPNGRLVRVPSTSATPGLATITEPGFTSGNEFLLDGVPYTGQYYQDLAGNYYTVPTIDPSSLTVPSTIQQPTNLSPAQLQELNLHSPGALAAQQQSSNQIPSNLSTQQPTALTNQTGSINPQPRTQTLSEVSASAIIKTNSAYPYNQIVVDNKGDKYVFSPTNELIPYAQAQKALQDSKNNVGSPRLLQPIASKVPPPGTVSGANRGSNLVNLQQQFIFNTKINPNFTGQPTSYYPDPTEDDYRNGYFIRYFVKKINQKGYIIEISFQEFDAINNGTVSYDVSDYQTINTFWKISGNLRTARLSQYDIREGIIETNKRLIENLERTYVGIKAFIGGEYTKFARPTQ